MPKKRSLYQQRMASPVRLEDERKPFVYDGVRHSNSRYANQNSLVFQGVRRTKLPSLYEFRLRKVTRKAVSSEKLLSLITSLKVERGAA